MRRKPEYGTCRVKLGAGILSVEYRLHPARAAPHVGADSPRFLDPGSPAHVEVLRVKEGGWDITCGLEAQTLTVIEQEVAKSVFRPPSPGRARPFPPFSGLALSVRAEKARRIGERILAAQKREAQDERDQLRIL